MSAREGTARRLLARMLVVMVALGAVSAAVWAGTNGEGRGSEPAAAGTTTSELDDEIRCTDAEGREVDCLPPHDEGKIAEETIRQPIGWGAAQPSNMGATVQRGSTDTALTPERRQLLAEGLKKARATAERIGTVGEARRLGFVQNNKEWLDGRAYEFVNWDWMQPTLNWEQPGVLVATGTDDDDPIVSIAYNVTRTREQGPPEDLPLEVIPWHYHHHLCWVGDEVIGNVETREDGTLDPAGAKRCLEAGAVYKPQYDHWMVDLWVVAGWENPWGLVSSKHPDLYRDPEPWFPEAQPGGTSH